VSAPFEKSVATGIDGNQADRSAAGAGAVYVFTRSGVGWGQQAYIKASNTDANDSFGISIALSGSGLTLAVGAQQEDSAATGIDGSQADNSSPSAGAVYIFVRTGLTWYQHAYIKASNTDAEDRFGGAVALSNDGGKLVVGASYERSASTGIDGNQADDSAYNAGAAYLFTLADVTWNQQAYIKASNTYPTDGFGGSVALSGDGVTLMGGASGEASAATGINGDQANNSAVGAGAVYVFR
jgi:hypothetical protein